MAEKIKLSIIICTYNVEKTIRGTLTCVFSSSFSRPYEVIVVDDASTDSTLDICKKYDVVIVRLVENRGPARARNAGVSNSKGEMIMFVDSDVTFAPDLFERMLNRMDQDSTLAGVGSISSAIPLNSGFYARYFALQEFFLITSVINNSSRTRFLCTRCGIIKRSVFDELGGFNEKYRKPSIEDYQFSLRLCNKHQIYWDKTFVNNHYFPDTLAKIWNRYHRNTKEMCQALMGVRNKDVGPFQEDAWARLWIGIAGVLCCIALWWPTGIIVAVISLLAAMIVKAKFLKWLNQNEGFIFSLKGWTVYVITSIPIATGLLCGIFSCLPALNIKRGRYEKL